jgi:hypothetical protein
MMPEVQNSGAKEKAVAREWLCKPASTATKYTCNYRRAVVGSVLCLVRPEAI